MLLDTARLGKEDKNGLVNQLAETLFSLTREVDPKGWWRAGSQIGILFTGINAPTEAERALEGKIRAGLRRGLGSATAQEIVISCKVFPEPRHKRERASASNL
jgi:hypothetical protein